MSCKIVLIEEIHVSITFQFKWALFCLFTMWENEAKLKWHEAKIFIYILYTVFNIRFTQICEFESFSQWYFSSRKHILCHGDFMELNCALIVASFQIFCFKNMSHLGKYKKKYASVQDFKQCHTVKMRSTAKFLLCYKFSVVILKQKK